ncbi:MAG TPA: hypothetical protein PKW18_12440 [Candidatus Sumerlaeota bacterium]|nr:MAG: hypothetical protein BWY12_02603 [candidate division BRC1 bacterium ADurb.Bin183]HOE64863.1 hypothetical protein [Candidatus Sumerlaeota bacterium]HRR32314.1 hypothetical protein [Candidatus Sumerlaeia bacterium]HON49667.1 hypothetical protein [Candidatus Sumerlaeota bacterium]HOR64086.1 hypothetical protein [Candidatus Sumerlaeota bacterium]
MYPEFHDIGKLVNWLEIGLQKKDSKGRLEPEPHEFENCKAPEWEIDFKAAPWEIIFRKDQQLRTKYWKGSLVWLWVTLGDHLAAGWGRTIPEKTLPGNPQYWTYSLWTGFQTQDIRLKSEIELKDLIRFLNQSPSWQNLVEKYKDKLNQRTEIARPGMNVTTLLSHSIIAGQLARVVGSVKNHEFDANGVWRNDNDLKAEKVKIIVTHYHVGFNQRPFRIADWNIFTQRRLAIQEAQKAYADNIISVVDNEMIGIFADEDQMKQFEGVILKKGFTLAKKQNYMPLKEKDNTHSKGIPQCLQEGSFFPVYISQMPETISLPICEVCQMAHADFRWPAHKLAQRNDITDTARRLLSETPWKQHNSEDFPEEDLEKIEIFLNEPEEEICAECFNLRMNATPLHKLHNWGGGRVAWIRSHLDIKNLINALTALHQNYIRESQKTYNPQYHQSQLEPIIENMQISFPLLVDFFNDYTNKFLRDLKNCFHEKFSEECVESVDNNLWCIHIEKKSDAIEIIKIFNKNMKNHFPKMIDITSEQLPCPVQLSLSLSSYKYPFFVHLRFLDDNKDDISVQLVNSGQASIKLPHLTEILNALPSIARSKLHGLTSIAQKSETLAKIVLEKKEKEHPPAVLSPLVPNKIDFKSLLTLTNLMED